MKNELLIKRILIIVSIITWVSFNIIEELERQGFVKTDIRLVTYSNLFVFIIIMIGLFKASKIFTLVTSGTVKLDERQIQIRNAAYYQSYWVVTIFIILVTIRIGGEQFFLLKAMSSTIGFTLTFIPAWILAWQGHKEIILEEDDDEDEEDFELISKIIK